MGDNVYIYMYRTDLLGGKVKIVVNDSNSNNDQQPHGAPTNKQLSYIDIILEIMLSCKAKAKELSDKFCFTYCYNNNPCCSYQDCKQSVYCTNCTKCLLSIHWKSSFLRSAFLFFNLNYFAIAFVNNGFQHGIITRLNPKTKS